MILNITYKILCTFFIIPFILSYAESDKDENNLFEQDFNTLFEPWKTNFRQSPLPMDSLNEQDLENIKYDPFVAIPKAILETRPFLCDFCDERFKRTNHRKRHIESKHMNLYKYVCTICQKKMTRADNMIQHIRCVHALILKQNSHLTHDMFLAKMK